jgi:RNA polymerase sigma-70 factor (ECF subfamily)
VSIIDVSFILDEPYGGTLSHIDPQMNGIADAALLERARRGDEQAFSELFSRHQRAIFRYAIYMCGSEAADDVVQDTFMNVLLKSGRYDASKGAVLSYLLGIARHLMLRRLSNSHSFPMEEFTEDMPVEKSIAGDTPLDAFARREAVAVVRAAVQSLPPAHREVIVLCELEEMDYAEAANIMQCPLGTVRSRLSRARALLSRKLGGVIQG